MKESDNQPAAYRRGARRSRGRVLTRAGWLCSVVLAGVMAAGCATVGPAYVAPERLVIDLIDTTDYPDGDWVANDVRLALADGDLVVTGTGGVREVFPRVHDPIGFRNRVQEASMRAFESERGRS